MAVKVPTGGPQTPSEEAIDWAGYDNLVKMVDPYEAPDIEPTPPLELSGLAEFNASIAAAGAEFSGLTLALQNIAKVPPYKGGYAGSPMPPLKHEDYSKPSFQKTMTLSDLENSVMVTLDKDPAKYSYKAVVHIEHLIGGITIPVIHLESLKGPDQEDLVFNLAKNLMAPLMDYIFYKFMEKLEH